jgi:hypothetical protein
MMMRTIDRAGDFEVEVFWFLLKVSDSSEPCINIALTNNDQSQLMRPPTPILARLPASISKSPPLVVTFIAPPLRLLVVTSNAMIPAAKPITAPAMQPHLDAFFQVMARAMGTTADPSTTPIYYKHQRQSLSGILYLQIPVRELAKYDKL